MSVLTLNKRNSFLFLPRCILSYAKADRRGWGKTKEKRGNPCPACVNSDNQWTSLARRYIIGITELPACVDARTVSLMAVLGLCHRMVLHRHGMVHSHWSVVHPHISFELTRGEHAAQGAVFSYWVVDIEVVDVVYPAILTGGKIELNSHSVGHNTSIIARLTVCHCGGRDGYRHQHCHC